MTNNQYTKTAIVLHWLIGLGILLMLGLGWYMADLPKDAPKAVSFDLFDEISNIGKFIRIAQ